MWPIIYRVILRNNSIQIHISHTLIVAISVTHTTRLWEYLKLSHYDLNHSFNEIIRRL